MAQQYLLSTNNNNELLNELNDSKIVSSDSHNQKIIN